MVASAGLAPVNLVLDPWQGMLPPNLWVVASPLALGACKTPSLPISAKCQTCNGMVMYTYVYLEW